jgi:4-hydroxy-tetrahydrodipicolinate reductase
MNDKKLIKITVTGCTGRMGRLVLKEINENPFVEISGALARPGNSFVGQDVGALIGESPLNILVSDQPETAFATADVVIEFSRPEAFEAHLKTVVNHQKPFVSCVTGLSENQQKRLKEASEEIPILFAPNTSLGVVLLRNLTKIAAEILGPSYDISLLEMHHRHKKDAPSGTSLTLGKSLSNIEHLQKNQSPYPSESPRSSGTIECAVLRGGGVIGDHSVIFAGEKDMITLEHRALDRGLFAQGALKAAQWLHGKKAGYYTIDDVVGISL